MYRYFFFIFHLTFIIFHNSIAFGVYVYKYILHHVRSIIHSPLIANNRRIVYFKKRGLNCLLRITENVTHIFFFHYNPDTSKKIIIFWEITGRVRTSLLYNIHIVCSSKTEIYMKMNASSSVLNNTSFFASLKRATLYFRGDKQSERNGGGGVLQYQNPKFHGNVEYEV